MILENALYGVFILAAAISLFIAILYKIFLDQEEMSKVKDKMDELKEKSEKAREGGDEDKANEHMQEMMKHSSKQMKMQLKPMAVTFIVIIPLFWFVFPNLYPATSVNLNETNTLEYKDVGERVSIQKVDPLTVSVGGEEYEKGEHLKIDGFRFQVNNYKEETGKLKLKRIAVMLPFSLPFFGNSLGWLGWYIMVAIGLGQVFRKLLGATP